MSVNIDIWHWRLDAPDPSDLSADERERANRFVFARDRARFIAARARLRRILGRYIDQVPGQIVFEYGKHGRPSVKGIDFNLSHTGDLAVLAVAKDQMLGIDIEAVHPIDMGVAKSHFAPSEFRILTALPENEQVGGFYRCWTRKEAYLKAKGTGLSTDLTSFSVSLAPDEPARLNFCNSGDAASWTLHDIAPKSGVAGALAVRTGGQKVNCVQRGRG